MKIKTFNKFYFMMVILLGICYFVIYGTQKTMHNMQESKTVKIFSIHKTSLYPSPLRGLPENETTKNTGVRELEIQNAKLGVQGYSSSGYE